MRELIATRLAVPSDRIYVCPPGAPVWKIAGPRSERPIRRMHPLHRDARSTQERGHAAGRVRAAHRSGWPARRGSSWQAAPPPTPPDGCERLSTPPLRGRAVHVGYVPDDQREALYASARVLVLPSLDEGLRPAGAGGDVRGSSSGGFAARIASRSRRLGRHARRPDRSARSRVRARALVTDEAWAVAQAQAGLARARDFSWADVRRHASAGIPGRRCIAAGSVSR